MTKLGLYRCTAGFTLVELVMVLVLVGVLSALGVGLITGGSAFSPMLASQQLSSGVLLAQQAALAGNPYNTLTVDQTAGKFTYDVGPHSFEIDREGTVLTVSGGLPHSVTFSPSGAPASAANTQFTFTGESTYTVCLSSLGAVYAGSCQP